VNAKNALELVVSTAIAVSENEGNGQNQENNTANERHFESEITQTKEGICELGDEPETEKRKRLMGSSHRRNPLYTAPEYQASVSGVDQSFEAATGFFIAVAKQSPCE